MAAQGAACGIAAPEIERLRSIPAESEITALARRRPGPAAAPRFAAARPGQGNDDMLNAFLLITVTMLYAGYNLLIKVSGNYVPSGATSTILATICLQLAALATSSLFAGVLLLRGGQNLQLGADTYLWALGAGLCIGGAEIAYFYLFGGLGGGKAMPANIAVPVIVSGTIVITMIVAYFVLKEPLTWRQILGSAVIVAGIGILFAK